MGSFFAKVKDAAVHFPKVEIISDGPIKTTCVDCGTAISHEKSQFNQILAVACCYACARSSGMLDSHKEISSPPVANNAETLNNISTENSEEVIEDTNEQLELDSRPLKCPVCQAPRKGRGYAHVDGCSESTAVKLAAMKANSANGDKPATCSVCNGPAKGRGYTHVDGCSESTAVKLAAMKNKK